MALVCARQSFLIEGYKVVERKKWFRNCTEEVKKPIRYLAWVKAICDESNVSSVIEEKIKEKVENEKGYYEGNFNGVLSYRKYCKPNEFYGSRYLDEKEFELKIDYIRNWKMQDILEALDGNQFATLCRELGINAEEAIKKA